MMARSEAFRLKFKMFSLADFTDRTLVTKVLDVVDSLPRNLKPERYGPHEPMESTYDPAKRSELVSAWLNEACVREDYQPHSGSLCMESGVQTKAEYHVAWDKDVAPRFNLISGSAALNAGQDSGGVRDFIDLATAIATVTDAAFGLIDREFPQTNNLLTLIDLKVRLPEPCWMMFFGSPYVQLFGRDRFLNAPCHEVVELPSGHFRLTVTPSPYEALAEETKERIREHFGRTAFTEPKKSIRSQKAGLVPSFDFSHVYKPKD